MNLRFVLWSLDQNQIDFTRKVTLATEGSSLMCLRTFEYIGSNGYNRVFNFLAEKKFNAEIKWHIKRVIEIIKQ